MSTDLDMTASIAPRSDQINAEDLITGPRTVTITDVTRGTAEQPVNIVTAEFGPGRPYKPSKTMRRMIVAAWGAQASEYVGRRLTIYRDPEITFGRDKVGGIRISYMSHIDKRIEIALAVTRGKRATFTVEPLPTEITHARADTISDDEAADFARDIAESSNLVELDADATALKSCDLGTHRKRLQAAWADRRKAISSTATSGEQEDAS
ncbi:hypothetical protein [Mycobacterium intracellulare]|uniref:hypothetical protein n=1 Tax=Mycobacterium intracellulare TaxID=1767 RepID=UPI00109E7B27|nr:hypothetical protein [Mycobacterium intracellulare]